MDTFHSAIASIEGTYMVLARVNNRRTLGIRYIRTYGEGTGLLVF